MKFAICNETFQDWPFEKAFEFASRCGYQAIEVAPFTINKDVRKISPAERADFRQQATQAGLEILGLHWLLAFTEGFYLTSPEPEVRLQTGNYLADLACFCADLGGNLMVLGSPSREICCREFPTLKECNMLPTSSVTRHPFLPTVASH